MPIKPDGKRYALPTPTDAEIERTILGLGMDDSEAQALRKFYRRERDGAHVTLPLWLHACVAFAAGAVALLVIYVIAAKIAEAVLL